MAGGNGLKGNTRLNEASSSSRGKIVAENNTRQQDLDKTKQTEKVTFYKLFSFADSTNRVLMIIGTIAAIGSGQNRKNKRCASVSLQGLTEICLLGFVMWSSCIFFDEKQAAASYNESLIKACHSGSNEGLTSGLGLGSLFDIMYCSYALAIWNADNCSDGTPSKTQRSDSKTKELGDYAMEAGSYWNSVAKEKIENCQLEFSQRKLLKVKGFKKLKLEEKLVNFFLLHAKSLESLIIVSKNILEI